jgi:glutamate carboxypeptidase
MALFHPPSRQMEDVTNRFLPFSLIMDALTIIRQCEEWWPHAKKFLREMVCINSFTTNVEGVNRVGEAVADQFASLGFAPLFVSHASPDYGRHLVLKRPPIEGAPTIALLAHLDTVFPEEEEKRNDFIWREENDRLYGPGTNDIKGGIALIFLTLVALREVSPTLFHGTNWVILCNACEEVDSHDFGILCRAQLPSDTKACLIFEADGGEGDRFSLVTARNGRATFRVEVQGHGAHAGSQHARGANAIVQLGRIIADFEGLTNHETGPTVNVGKIQGGTVLNRVPEHAVAELEMRAFSVSIFEAAKQHILSRSGAGDVCSRDEDKHCCQIHVRQIDKTSPWPLNPASDQLLTAWQLAAQELGFEVDTERRGGLSDGNVLWNHFPTLDGLGPMGDYCHCSENDPANGKQQEFADEFSFVPKAALNIVALSILLTAP